MSKIIPNTFMCFNLYVDKAMHHLSDSELRVLLFATRHILGWQDRIDSRSGNISLSMFVDGFESTDEDGIKTKYGGCGLGEAAVRSACKSLCRFKFLAKVGVLSSKGQQWRLGASPDWTALESRTTQQVIKRKQQVEKATIAAAIKRGGVTSNDTLSFDDRGLRPTIPLEATSNDTPGVTLDDRSGVTSNEVQQSHIQSHDQNQLKKEGNALPPAYASMVDDISDQRAVQPIDNDTVLQMKGAAIISAYEAMHRGYNVPQKVELSTKNRRMAAEIARDYSLDEVRAVLREALERGVVIPFNFLQEKLGQARLNENKPSSVKGAGLRPAPVALIEDTNDTPTTRAARRILRGETHHA